MNPTRALIAVLFSAAIPAGALEWHTRGPRALGMGGAGVALAQGPLASYWNPAALGRPTANAYGIQIPFGIHAALTGDVIAGAKDLRDLQERGTPPTQTEIDAALAKFDHPGSGLRFDADFGTDFKAGKLGVFFNVTVDAGAVPSVDRTNTNPATFLATNQSKLIVKGANIAELGAAYGHELPFASGLYLGGALKVMSAQVGYADYFVLREDTESGNIPDKIKSGARKSSNFGVDLGALWDLDQTFGGVPLKPRVGLVGRNLNNPKFKQPDAARLAGHGDNLTVNPQVRLGASITPLPWWNVAVDVDLTRNLTFVDKAASRQLGLGNEFNVFNRAWINIPLRVGLMRNTAETSAGTMFTFGAGLNFLHFMLDASAAVSSRRVTTMNNEKIPREVAVGAQLSVLFGGVDADHKPAAPRRVADDQAVPSETIRKASEKAHEDLKIEELKNSAPAEKPSTQKP